MEEDEEIDYVTVGKGTTPYDHEEEVISAEQDIIETSSALESESC